MSYSYREYSLLTIINNTTVNPNKGKRHLKRVVPRQLDNHHYSKSGNLCKRTRRYLPDPEGRFFSHDLNLDKLVEALRNANVEQFKYSIHQRDKLVWYTFKRPRKPTIALNLEEGRFYTTTAMLEKFELPLIELQAYIITEILKKSGLSNAKRGKCKFAKPGP